MTTQGPNVRRLITRKIAVDAIPPGGGIQDGFAFLSNPKGITEAARKATAWVNDAIQAVRQAAEPNPWKDVDDELIAHHILKEMERRTSDSE